MSIGQYGHAIKGLSHRKVSKRGYVSLKHATTMGGSGEDTVCRPCIKHVNTGICQTSISWSPNRTCTIDKVGRPDTYLGTDKCNEIYPWIECDPADRHIRQIAFYGGPVGSSVTRFPNAVDPIIGEGHQDVVFIPDFNLNIGYISTARRAYYGTGNGTTRRSRSIIDPNDGPVIGPEIDPVIDVR